MAWLSEFPGCCGISVIDNFEDMLEFEEDNLKAALKDHRADNRGLALVALADYQIKQYGPLLKKNKFEVVMKFRNPRHNSMITLYAKKTPRKGTAVPLW